MGDYQLLTVTRLITLDLITQDLAVVTHTDPAWFRLPDVLVGVHLAVRWAASLLVCSRQKWENASISLIRSCGFFVIFFLFFWLTQLFYVRITVRAHTHLFLTVLSFLLANSCIDQVGLSWFLPLPNAANASPWMTFTVTKIQLTLLYLE